MRRHSIELTNYRIEIMEVFQHLDCAVQSYTHILCATAAITILKCQIEIYYTQIERY